MTERGMTEHRRIKAAFYRGGTSKAVVFNGADLPADRALRDKIFLHVMGSPDPYGRQLDGMGGGLSSLSKVAIVEPSSREDADVDYTFVQIAVGEPVADYGSACGNMSSAVGPFAVDEGMVAATGERARVRIYSTNTDQIYLSEFPVRNGRAVEEGDFEIPGVSGAGAKVRLDFLNPAGAFTGKLLPSGRPLDRLEIDGVGTLDVSMIDAANPVVFVRAADIGCSATETPQALDGDAEVMATLEAIRRAAAVAMGLSATPAATSASNPKVAMVAPPRRFTALDGRAYAEADCDVSVRLVSVGNVHRAVTLTGAMCVAVAAKIPGSLVDQASRKHDELRIGNPSGVLPVMASVVKGDDSFEAQSATTFRTQRRIMDGEVLYPARLHEGD